MPNAHTPCPACAIQVRALYEAAAVVVAWVDLQNPALPATILENLRLAVASLSPFIEAHLENQLHALSPELMSARFPGQTPELTRGLPFGE